MNDFSDDSIGNSADQNNAPSEAQLAELERRQVEAVAALRRAVGDTAVGDTATADHDTLTAIVGDVRPLVFAERKRPVRRAIAVGAAAASLAAIAGVGTLMMRADDTGDLTVADATTVGRDRAAVARILNAETALVEACMARQGFEASRAEFVGDVLSTQFFPTGEDLRRGWYEKVAERASSGTFAIDESDEASAALLGNTRRTVSFEVTADGRFRPSTGDESSSSGLSVSVASGGCVGEASASLFGESSDGVQFRLALAFSGWIRTGNSYGRMDESFEPFELPSVASVGPYSADAVRTAALWRSCVLSQRDLDAGPAEGDPLELVSRRWLKKSSAATVGDLDDIAAIDAACVDSSGLGELAYLLNDRQWDVAMVVAGLTESEWAELIESADARAAEVLGTK